MNREAQHQLRAGPPELKLFPALRTFRGPGTLEQVAKAAAEWFSIICRKQNLYENGKLAMPTPDYSTNISSTLISIKDRVAVITSVRSAALALPIARRLSEGRCNLVISVRIQ